MSGWNLQVEFLHESHEKRNDGTYETRLESRFVWANPMTIGTTAWLAGRSAGLHPDAMIEVWAHEYCGQERVRIGSVEYNIESAQATDGTTRLTLTKRLNDE